MNMEMLPEVASVGVRRTDCEDYEVALRRALELSGTFTDCPAPGFRVLVKPDLSYDCGRVFQSSLELIAAVCRVMAEAGGEVTVGDSPGYLGGRPRDIWETGGLVSLADREGFSLAVFENYPAHPVAIDTTTYFIARPAVEADLVVNLARLRPDPVFGMAAAVRNVTGLVPGFHSPPGLHAFESPADLAERIADVYSAVRPAINIVEIDDLSFSADGGLPAPAGIMVSTDGVALDATIAGTVGLSPDRIETTRICAEAGLGIGWLEGIREIGDRPDCRDSACRRRFTPRKSLADPIIGNLIRRFLWFRPAIIEAQCDDCGECEAVCPVNSLAHNGLEHPLSIGKELCISCLRCREVCPRDAIRIDRSAMLRCYLAARRKLCGT